MRKIFKRKLLRNFILVILIVVGVIVFLPALFSKVSGVKADIPRVKETSIDGYKYEFTASSYKLLAGQEEQNPKVTIRQGNRNMDMIIDQIKSKTPEDLEIIDTNNESYLKFAESNFKIKPESGSSLLEFEVANKDLVPDITITPLGLKGYKLGSDVIFATKTNRKAYSFSSATAVDTEGQTVNADLDVQKVVGDKDSEVVKFVIDSEWLNSPDRAYPLTLSVRLNSLFDKKMLQMRPTKATFMASENPEFEIDTLFINDLTLQSRILDGNFDGVRFGLIDTKGQTVNLDAKLKSKSGDIVIVELFSKKSYIKAGLFDLLMQYNDNPAFISESEFAWGVLAINPDQSVYKTDSLVNLDFAVLDKDGMMACDAQLSLTITEPDGNQSFFSTDAGNIEVTEGCKQSITDLPDFNAKYQVKGEGDYKLDLIAQTSDGTYAITDKFKVDDNSPFYVRRASQTRIFPSISYEMQIEVTKGTAGGNVKIVETVDKDFIITDTDGNESPALVEVKHISWDRDFSQADKFILKYRYDAPDESPVIFMSGPLQINDIVENKLVFEEGRNWQIAVDAVVVSGGIVTAEAQFGGLQRKVVYVNSNWYAFYNDGGNVSYKKSADGVSWGTAVDMDSADAGTDDYNPSVDFSGNIIHVAWVDDGDDQIEARQIDTGSSDTLGTLCNITSPGTISGSTYVTTIASLSTTDVVTAISDTAGGTPVDIYKATGLNGACTVTDIETGNIVFGSGITGDDRPQLVGISSTRVGMIFQDGNLSYSEFDVTDNEWHLNNLTIASVTDNVYSSTTNGTKVWVLTDDAANSTDTNFYTLNNAVNQDFSETTVSSGTSGNDQDGLSALDMSCVAADDCKFVYTDDMDSNGPDVIFVDCNNASCSSATSVTIDSDCGAAGENCNPAIHCSSGTDCHIVYMDSVTAPDIYFVDCDGANNTNACSTANIVNTDADFGGTSSKAKLDIDCPTGDNCKFIYGDDDTNSIVFVDCADDQCAVATDTLTPEIIDYGTSVVGPHLAIDCPTSTTCKVLAHDIDAGTVALVDCSTAGTPETCATPPAQDTIESGVGTTASGVSVDIDCLADGTDCKIVYTNDTNNDLIFGDCNDTDCDTPTKVTLDTNGGSGDTNEAQVEMSCVAANDCKILYTGALTDNAEELYFIDCDDVDCNPGSVIDMPGPRFRSSLHCLTSTDCKMVYYEGTSASVPAIIFNDCDTTNCFPSVTDDADPWGGESTVTSVSLTYDSTNTNLIANIVKDATNQQAYYSVSSAATISWGTSTAYDGFTAGAMDNLSTPETAAGTSQMGALVRLGSNMEFDLYAPIGPTMDQVMRHGNWFSGGTEQSFYWVD